MAVFIRPNRGAAATRLIHSDFVPGVILSQHGHDKYCLSLTASELALVLFDKEGEAIKDGSLKAGQRAHLNFGALNADKYHLMLIPNPELARTAYIGGPILIEPYTTERLDYMLKVERPIDLSKLDYLFRVYIMD
jgi:hypothetical protein